ncbi:ribosomal protein P0 (A0) (L10E) [Rhodotorula kratochvilovae]
MSTWPPQPPAPPPAVLERCAVCGTATKTRCSACFKAGTPIFFCRRSIRSSSGPPTANPCLLPPLTADEANEVLRLADVPTVIDLRASFGVQSGPYQEGGTLRQMLQDSPDVPSPPGWLEGICLPYLTSGEDLAAPGKQVWLYRMRNTLYTIYQGVRLLPYVPYDDLTAWCHVSHFQTLVRIHFPDLAPPEALSRFRHHALILVTLMHKRVGNPASIPDDWLKRAFELLVGATNDDELVFPLDPFAPAAKSHEFVKSLANRVYMLGAFQFKVTLAMEKKGTLDNLLAVALVTDVSFEGADKLKEILANPEAFAAAAAPATASADAGAAAPAADEKKEDEEASDDDMG